MASSNSATVESIAQAGRYLSALGASVGFGEALRRVQARSSVEVAEKLHRLKNFVDGNSSELPGPELALIGEIARQVPSGADAGKAINVANAALSDARVLADQVRVGLPGDLAYAVLLLAVTALVSVTWLSSIAPSFAAMFDQFGAELPAYSRLLVSAPWLLLVAIGVVGLALIGLVLAARSMGNRIESIAPLESGLISYLYGGRIRQAHDRWRVITLARAWFAAGQQPVQAVQQAVAALKISGEAEVHLTAALALASELGAEAVEMEHQTFECVGAYRDALEFWRAMALRILQVAIAVLVGAVVLAIYLPIFKMGAVV